MSQQLAEKEQETKIGIDTVVDRKKLVDPSDATEFLRVVGMLFRDICHGGDVGIGRGNDLCAAVAEVARIHRATLAFEVATVCFDRGIVFCTAASSDVLESLIASLSEGRQYVRVCAGHAYSHAISVINWVIILFGACLIYRLSGAETLDGTITRAIADAIASASVNRVCRWDTTLCMLQYELCPHVDRKSDKITDIGLLVKEIAAYVRVSMTLKIDNCAAVFKTVIRSAVGLSGADESVLDAVRSMVVEVDHAMFGPFFSSIGKELSVLFPMVFMVNGHGIVGNILWLSRAVAWLVGEQCQFSPVRGWFEFIVMLFDHAIDADRVAARKVATYLCGHAETSTGARAVHASV